MPTTQDRKSNVVVRNRSDPDLPPAYDTLSLHHSTDHDIHRTTSTSDLLHSVSGPSNPDSLTSRAAESNKTLPTLPPLDDASFSQKDAGHVLTKRPRPRKNTSWLSLLPFVSTSSAKRVRQSVSSIVNDLVISPSRAGEGEQKNEHEVLASLAETCVEHKVSLSAILQENLIADHTPVYWAIVNRRQKLLLALLVHSRPLSVQTISDIRRACLVSSNQEMFQALRVCRPPFHSTDGIQVPSLRAASDNLLLGNRPLDEICIQQTSDQVFVVSFDIPLWQRRMKAIGRVSIEFIVSGRMWSVTFFSKDPSSPAAESGKSKKSADTWHVIVSLLESSPPTFFNSQLVVDVQPPPVPTKVHTQRFREARSTTFPSSGVKQYHSQSSMYDYNRLSQRSSRGQSREGGYLSSPSFHLPPPVHPLRGSPLVPRSNDATLPPPIVIRLRCGDRKLARRAGTEENPMTKPNTWSDQGVSYTSAAVSSLGEGLPCRLLHDHSPYLLPDGTLRGRLEARLVKTEMTKDCIIC